MICFVPVYGTNMQHGFQIARRKLEAVLHVGAVDEVPRHLGQLLGGEVAGDLAEADEAEVVAREVGGDQRVQRHGHLLGGQEVVA